MTSMVVASPNQISCDVADEAVLLSMQCGEYFGLNPVGASIWRLIQERRVVEDVVDALLEEYSGITAEECRREVLGFLAEMSALGFVEVIATPQEDRAPVRQWRAL